MTSDTVNRDITDSGAGPRRAYPSVSPDVVREKPSAKALAVLTLGALGVVYGDIGTSPLYSVKECFQPAHGIAVTEANVLGVMSMIFWALTIVISLKYMVFVLRADNHGEGGILALMSLALAGDGESSPRIRRALVILGLFGAALLYGDGMITPAISVLSAVEGLAVSDADSSSTGAASSPLAAQHNSPPYVVAITVVILVALFLVQKHGTARIGAVFGPIMLIWFAAIAALGMGGIVREPHVLYAISPHHAAMYFWDHGLHGVIVLGSVFLVVTGGEALYADMGHFGRRPIRMGWYWFALPALVLNYFGQCALLLAVPEAFGNPFYRLVPQWALYPMVGLATMATIIASQAVISGAFSLTRQAVQLGYFPRVPIVHTSSKEIGQIYVPLVNTLLMVCTVGLVLGFRSSSNLAAAYGVAVTATMAITTVLLFVVQRHVWAWKLPIVLAVTGLFLVIDLSFFGATALKIFHGGWFPLFVGIAIYAMMSTWRRGRYMLGERLRERILPLEGFVQSLAPDPPHRVNGAAVYMSGNTNGTPPVLLHNLKHNQVLHQVVVFLTVVTEEVPYVAREHRLALRTVGDDGIYQLMAHYGFMESPHVPEILDACKDLGLHLDMNKTTFFLGREMLIPTRHKGLAMWRKRLFAFMSRNAQAATSFFEIPPGQVVELGIRVEL